MYTDVGRSSLEQVRADGWSDNVGAVCALCW